MDYALEIQPHAKRGAKWALVAAVNNDSVLRSCLLSSPDLCLFSDVVLQHGYSSAAAAYNDALGKVEADNFVFIHQDVYLPKGWLAQVEGAVKMISAKDPNWGVLGAWGVRASGDGFGLVYCGANRKVLGESFEGGKEVQTLDEVLLITRGSSGLTFDDKLTGFHMYGSDICLQASQRGMRAYAISCLCIHNTNQYGMLPLQFWGAYLKMRRKWKSKLPVTTSCIRITRSCWPMVRYNVVRALNLMTGRDPAPVKRVADPSELYKGLHA